MVIINSAIRVDVLMVKVKEGLGRASQLQIRRMNSDILRAPERSQGERELVVIVIVLPFVVF